MILMPIVYVLDMDESVAFYEGLGFEVDHRSPHWTELKAGDRAVLALHVAEADTAGRVELAMVAEELLERVAGAAPVARGIADEAFGRSVVLRDPTASRSRSTSTTGSSTARR